MKIKSVFVPSWIAVALVLAGSRLFCNAAANITYTFDSDVQGWYAGDGNGTVTWDATHGTDGGGCLKAIISTAATNVEVDPRIDVSVNSAQYFSIELDVMVDAASGTSGGNYGNLQAIMRDSTWSWNSMWYGALNSSFNTYRHLKFVLPSPYIAYEHLQFQLYSGTPSSDIIVYMDNITITAIATPPNPTVLNAFVRATDVTDGLSSWAGGSPAATANTISWDTNHDAGMGFTPLGSMKMQVDYNTSNSGWQEGDAQMAPYTWDPSRFTYFDFDLYIDAATGMSTYGSLNVFIISGSYGWVSAGGPSINASMIGKWTHFSFPLASTGLNSSHGWVFQVGGGMTNTITYYFDNIRAWTPATPPALTSVSQAGNTPGGAKITMNLTGPANQWQRDAICVPAGQTDYTWYNKGGVTFSFGITNFPDPIEHPGFEAHLYIVNQDTIPGTGTGWNQTYGGCDWNAADIAMVRLVNNATGGVDFAFAYKTNTPAADATNRPASFHAPSALGTWYLTFGGDNVSVTLSNSSGLSTNFTLPQEVADRFDSDISWIQIGAFKNDGAADGHNDGASCTFSEIAMDNGTFPFYDNFGGPGLTANGAWRTTSASAVQWVPSGLGAWLTWTLPDDNYSVEVAGKVTGPYTNAGVTYTYAQGDKRTGAVPASSLPPGNAAFFRLSKPVTP